MEDIERARDRWLEEESLYKSFVNYLIERVAALLRFDGLWVRVSGRAKELDSLLKKLLRRPDLVYNTVTDKAGVRIVVRFLEDLDAAVATLKRHVAVLKEESVTARLGDDKFGYQGVHLDATLLGNDPEFTKYGQCTVEIQVRTLSQDAWSDMAHELSYKADINVPKSLRRRVNCLSALMETADREFSAVNQEIMKLPDAGPMRIRSVLEKYYYKMTAEAYDKELSLDVIRLLWPLLHVEERQAALHFQQFYDKNQAKVALVFKTYSKLPNRSLFLSQPEILLIFSLFDIDPFSLRDTWNQQFSDRELQKLGVAWGRPLD